MTISGDARRLAAPFLLAALGGILLCLGLAYGGYWAAALAIGGPKYGDLLRHHLVYGVLCAGAGTGILVTARRLPQAR